MNRDQVLKNGLPSLLRKNGNFRSLFSHLSSIQTSKCRTSLKNKVSKSSQLHVKKKGS